MIAINSFSRNRIHRKGFTLTEILLSLAIMTGIIAIGTKIFASATDASKINRTLSDVTEINSIIQALYQYQPGYLNVSPDTIHTSLSPGVYHNGTITNAFIGIIAVTSDTIVNPDDSFDVIVTNVSASACIRLATAKFGDTLYSVHIDPNNGAALVSSAADAITTLPISTATATAKCTGDRNSVGFQFR